MDLFKPYHRPKFLQAIVFLSQQREIAVAMFLTARCNSMAIRNLDISLNILNIITYIYMIKIVGWFSYLTLTCFQFRFY